MIPVVSILYGKHWLTQEMLYDLVWFPPLTHSIQNFTFNYKASKWQNGDLKLGLHFPVTSGYWLNMNIYQRRASSALKNVDPQT